jgi:D-alanyl-D-alanine carboxypeptidase/D-alanyl-D-alanine-endopeptidase (penicillin-binding protein 4)
MIMISDKRFIVWICLSVLLPLWVMPAGAQEVVEEENDSVTVTAVLPADTLGVDTMAADTLPWPESLRQRLDLLLTHPLLKKSQVGLMVYDLTADSALYCYQERQTLRPASTMKVVTSITALDKLGDSHQFKTRLMYTGKIEEHTLTGDLYCVGGFDPRFNSDDMRSFVESLRKMGVDTIRGRLIADVSMKDDKQFGEGWCWDDDNDVLTPLLISRKDQFIERFEQGLKDDGVVLECSKTMGRVPAGAFEVTTRFHTMDQILMKMMKESDNLYAESMFYQIAASTGNRPASARSARSVINKLIRKVGLNPSDYKVADGSGLSLYNYVSAELEVALLRYAFRNDNIYLHLYPSLPIAGEDGTLKKRMKGTFAAGNVHAKTGTVTCVTSLAGYCTAANGHKLAFSIINQGCLRDSESRAFQDRVCVAMCQP